jgi:hypothetical protein
MSGTSVPPRIRVRRLVVRGTLVAACVALAAVAFLLGKGHTILVDNKDAEDGSVQAIDGVLVGVDGQEPLELYSGDRDKAVVRGQSHTVTIEAVGGGTKVQKRIHLPIGVDVLLLSIPKLAAGAEQALVAFVAPPSPPPAEDSGEASQFTSPGGEEPGAVPVEPAPAP